MTKIVFQGKEYDNLADMPAKIRHNYFKFKAGYDISEEKPEEKPGIMPNGMENMPDDVREIYERVRGELDAKPLNTKASPMDKLPKTEDLYRRTERRSAQCHRPCPLPGRPDRTSHRAASRRKSAGLRGQTSRDA